MTDSQTSKTAAPETVASRLEAVKARMAEAARAVGRDPAEVTLVAISKVHPVERLEEALAAGHRVFGENRVQEARAKFPDLRQRFPDMAVHLVGPLQTNKVADAVALFDVVETLDREKLARAFVKERDKTGRCPDLYVQVNTGEEPQKAGIPPREAEAFVKLARDELELPVVGLMCIPPVDEEPALHFALLRDIAARCGLDRLSMGMSDDYETAIKLGATSVRVGTGVFGRRPGY